MAIEQHAYAVGQATVTRIKELVLSNFTPEALFPDWDASVLVDHPDWLPPETMDKARKHNPDECSQLACSGQRPKDPRRPRGGQCKEPSLCALLRSIE